MSVSSFTVFLAGVSRVLCESLSLRCSKCEYRRQCLMRDIQARLELRIANESHFYHQPGAVFDFIPESRSGSPDSTLSRLVVLKLHGTGAIVYRDGQISQHR